MVIIRYFLSDPYIAKSQLSSVNCQPKATHHRENTPPIYPPTNYQLPGSKLSVSRQETPYFSVENTPPAISTNHKYTLQNGNQSMHSRIQHRQSTNQS